MGPGDNLTLGSNSDSTSLSVPKLHDDGSNWADYEPRVERALGMKGLWRHIVGTAIAPKPYAVVARVPVLADGITQASDDQVESKESKIADSTNGSTWHNTSVLCCPPQSPYGLHWTPVDSLQNTAKCIY